MIRYLHILLAIAAEPLAIEREKLSAILSFLMLKADGGEVSAEDVARISQKSSKEITKAPGSVGLLSVIGVLGQRMNMMDDISSGGGASTQMITQAFRGMVADDAIKAIVMEFDSPGGGVFGIQELADEMFSARGIKPIIAQVNSTMASAAFWIGSQADEIVVTPGGRAGSIGVYTVHDDISKMLAEKGITRTVVASHPNKIMGGDHEPLSDGARADMQARVATLQTRFETAVARGRNTTVSKVRDRMGNGLTFLAEDLVDRGMADRIGTLDDTLERFGAQVRPAIMRSHQQATIAQQGASELFSRALKTGDPALTLRQVQDGLRGILGLSKAESERAVANLISWLVQGDPATASLTESADAVRQHLQSLASGLMQLRGMVPKLKS